MKLRVLFVAILFFISESIFVEVFSAQLYASKYIIVPRFTLIFLVFLVVYGKKNTAFWYAVGLGAFYDVVYTEVLGIYLFMLPIVVYLASQLMKVLQVNLAIVSFVSLLAISVLEVIVFEINTLIGFSSLTFMDFARLRLLPSLVLNLLFLILFAYFLAKWIRKWTVEED